MSTYLVLAIAIVAEVVATSALKASEGFTRIAPLALVAVGYGIAFYCLSLTLKSIPVGIAYGVWSGAGIVLISAIGWVVYGEKLDLARGHRTRLHRRGCPCSQPAVEVRAALKLSRIPR